jgi:hypothetical protein
MNIAVNGHDTGIPTEEQELEQRDRERFAARQVDTKSISVFEATKAAPPFEQQTHTLMLESVDQLTNHWVKHLTHARENNKGLEQQVLERAAALRDQITRLHLLGVQVMKEAERGDQINAQLAAELDRMMEEHRTS